MEKIIKEYELYSYDELSEEAKIKTLENLSDINTDYDWWKFTLEDEKEVLEKKGFINADISFSGFSSQGDGASFSCTVDINKFLDFYKLEKLNNRLLKIKDFEECSIAIKKSGRYENEYTMNTDLCFYDNNEAVNELEESVLKIAREEAKRVYKNLNNEYNALNEREAIEETIRANEYVFFKKGGEIQNNLL